MTCPRQTFLNLYKPAKENDAYRALGAGMGRVVEMLLELERLCSLGRGWRENVVKLFGIDECGRTETDHLQTNTTVDPPTVLQSVCSTTEARLNDDADAILHKYHRFALEFA